MTGPKTLLIDIETAPAKAYIWDLKTRYVPLSQIEEDGYMLCFAASWLDGEHIEFSSRWHHGEEQMVRWAWDLMDEADAIVHYNGNRFDIPRLNAEFLKYRIGPPSPAHQIDLFQTVSSNFKVLSKSMNHILKLLSLDEKVAHKGMALWTEVMAGNKKAQKIMEEYNIGDVRALDDLYYELRPWIRSLPNQALWMKPVDKPICPSCGSTDLRNKGFKHTRTQAYQQFKCNNCGTYPRLRTGLFTGKNRRKDTLT